MDIAITIDAATLTSLAHDGSATFGGPLIKGVRVNVYVRLASEAQQMVGEEVN